MMSGVKQIRVLLVEDDAGDRELTKLALDKSSAARFDIVFSDGLTAAIEHLRNDPFDVMLLDLGLPESCGLETLARIRHVNEDVPIVVLTDLCDEEAALASLDQGAQDFLLKSQVAADTLSQSIRYAIQRQHLLSELSATNELLQQKNDHLARLCDTAQKFVDNVSHEFRTPLTVIKEYVSLLREGVIGQRALDAEQCRFLDVVADRAGDLNTMVDDMLDVSKLEAGILSAWRQRCSVRDIVENVFASLEKKAAVKGVELRMDVSERLPEVYCDSEKAGRVIINLAVNAIKFCQEPGHVRLWARAEDSANEVVVGVTDNGPGIDQEGLAAIFKRFRQLGSGGRGSCKGFGLGLHIAKELVDLNYGEMNVESELGTGSTFSFTLPLARPEVVVRRYLDQVEQMRDGSSTVSLLHACIDASVETSLASSVDAFLNYILRGNDLLFRCDEHRWLLLVPAAEIEAREFVDRAEKLLGETNHNRPQGRLPEIEMVPQGTWQVAEEAELILTHLRESLGVLEVAHV